MLKTLEECNYANLSINLVPFVDDIPEVKGLSGDELVICWGPSFVPRAKHYPALLPGIWFEPQTFNWGCFQKNWKEYILSQDGEIVTLSAALSCLSSRRVFMRPNEDSKIFDGGVYEKDSPPVIKHIANNDDKVVIAEPRDVVSEWRFFIVGKNVIAESSYRIDSSATIEGFIPSEARDLAKEASKIWGPDDVYCLDVGYDGKTYGIIEANCFNASRIYGANAADIVKNVSEFTRKQHN